MNQLVGPLFQPLTRWAENSQRNACRNAMVASTALAAGRRERDETAEYVDLRARPTCSPSRCRDSHSSRGPARLRLASYVSGPRGANSYDATH